ncbi:hypothetical protein CYK37_06860 [Mesorhizobium loti]|nr:hypothetical protein CYK37_06860 [Mesorhizobium loti]
MLTKSFRWDCNFIPTFADYRRMAGGGMCCCMAIRRASVQLAIDKAVLLLHLMPDAFLKRRPA